MAERNKYRDMIASRKDKEKTLTDVMALEKIDMNALNAAIEAAVANRVAEHVIERGREKMRWLTYCKEVEQSLVQALQEKVKDNILAVLERIEKEGIAVEPKMLADAKNVLSKLK
jgi:hypothetical protein